MNKNNNCAFCEDELKDEQEIIRNSLVKVIYPRRPVVESSVMIMPIRHCENFHDLTHNEISSILDVVKDFQTVFSKLYNTEGYNLFLNNGFVAGQHIPHVHFHLYGRLSNEAMSPFTVLNNQEIYSKLEKLTLALIRERADKMKKEFNKL